MSSPLWVCTARFLQICFKDAHMAILKGQGFEEVSHDSLSTHQICLKVKKVKKYLMWVPQVSEFTKKGSNGNKVKKNTACLWQCYSKKKDFLKLNTHF